MEKSAITIAALGPCLIILSIIVYSSRRCVPTLAYRELIFGFLLGMLSCLPILLWAIIFGHWENSLVNYPVEYCLYGALMMAAIPEEFCRFLILLWRSPRLPSPVNLINSLLLGSVVGLGFGAVEHIEYSLNEGWRACWERLLLGVSIHTMAGAIVGYFVGLSVIKRRRFWSMLGVSITILLHAINNFSMAYLFEPLLQPDGQLQVQSEFVESLYWPIRIFILLTYLALTVILYYLSKRTKRKGNQE